MSPSSSTFKKKLRKKHTSARVKRVVSSRENYYKTALSQSRVNNMSQKKRIQKLLENNKSLAQALESAEISRQQQEQVILSLQRQLTLTNSNVIKRNIKKMGILIQQVVNLMTDTLEHVMHIDGEEEEEDVDDVLDSQLPPLSADNVPNGFCPVPEGTPVKHSATGPQRRSLHSDLREKFGVCDLTVINEDTLRLQEMNLPPILFTEGDNNVNNSRHSRRNSSRHKSSRKGRSTISLSSRGSSVESSDPSDKKKKSGDRVSGFEEFQEHHPLNDPSVRVSSQHVLRTPQVNGNGCSELPSSEPSLQTPKTPVLSPFVLLRSKQVTKSNIPRLVKENPQKTASDEILYSDGCSAPVHRRETFVVSNAVSQHDAASILERSSNQDIMPCEATSYSQSIATGLADRETEGARRARCDIQTTSPLNTGLADSETKGARKARHSTQTASPLKDTVLHTANISGNNPNNDNCVLPHFEDVTVNLGEDMEFTCPVGNFFAPRETHTAKIDKLVQPSVVNGTEQQSCNSEETSDMTEIYCPQAYCNTTAKFGLQPKTGTFETPVVCLAGRVGDCTKSRFQSQKETSRIRDLLNSSSDEGSDATEIYNVKAFCSTLSHIKDQTDKKQLTPRRIADGCGPQSEETDVPIGSEHKSQVALSNSGSPLTDHNVRAISKNSSCIAVELDAHDLVTNAPKEAECEQPGERFVTRATKSKGNETTLPPTVSSPSDSVASLQSADRRGTFVLPRAVEEQWDDPQPGPSGVSSLSKRRSRVTANARLSSSQELKLQNEAKSPHESPKNSPYRFPENDFTSRSREKTRKGTKTSKNSAGSTSCTLGRKKLHLSSQFSKLKSHSKKGSANKEPNFKFFSKKSSTAFVKNATERKADKPDQNDAAKQMNVYDVITSRSDDDQVVERPLTTPAGEEMSGVPKRKDPSGSPKDARSFQNVTEVPGKTKACTSSKLQKRKSTRKENLPSKRAKLENQSKKESILVDSSGGVSPEKEQSHSKSNLRSHHLRKSVSFRVPSEGDIHFFNINASICMSSESDHKVTENGEVERHEIETETTSKSPVMVEETNTVASEHKQCRNAFVVLEDIFAEVGNACHSEKPNDSTGRSTHISNTCSLHPSDVAKSPVKDSHSRSELPKRGKNQKSVAEADLDPKENNDCGSSVPSSAKEKVKGPEKTDAAQGETVEEIASDKAPQGHTKATIPHQAKKSTHRGNSSVKSAETSSHPENVRSIATKDDVQIRSLDSEQRLTSVEPSQDSASSKDQSTKLSEDETLKKRTSKKSIKTQNTGDDVPTKSRKENVSHPSRSSRVAEVSIETLDIQRESSGRSRRRTGVVSYREPSLGTKLRRGDVLFGKN